MPPSDIPEHLVEDRAMVDDLGPQTVGNDYGCAVVSRARQVLILVASESARPAAERLRLRLRRPELAEVRVVAKRFRWVTMRKIRSVIEATIPDNARSWALGREFPFDRETCPRIIIRILPAGRADPAAERWASDAVRRYGRDRVVIQRWEGAHLT
jgi:hypothetical protein